MLTQQKRRRWLPRVLEDRLETTRRDVAMVMDVLAGRNPPHLVPRPVRTFADTAPLIAQRSLTPRPARVARIVRETPDAVSVFLEEPNGRKLPFLPGQFLTLEVEVAGQRLRRAYSLSTSPFDGAAAITVKRVPGGRVSGWINDELREGHVLQVLGPSGSFTVTPNPDTSRHVVLLAGGSGITPILSIARALLAGEPSSRVTLVYGNRRLEDVIFRDALDALARDHDGRLVVDHVLSEPPAGWPGATGLLDGPTVAARLDALAIADAADLHYYVCGPEPMREAVRATLAARGVPPSRTHEEIFVRPELSSNGRPPPEGDQTLHVKKNGIDRTAVVREGQTLLEAGLAAGVELPFSCAMGGCAECKCKVVQGEVVMEEPNCLTAEERDQGYVLTCVSRPLGTVRLEVAG